MNFTKFVAMLENNGLFFSRIDRLDDPLEGSYPQANVVARQTTIDAIKHAEGVDIGETFQQIGGFVERNRQWIMVNCWHMNEHESAAMWKLYAQSNEAIAIQSSYTRLAHCLDKIAYLGVMKYLDYAHDTFSDWNALLPTMHKRKSFEHERELRAVVWDLPIVPVEGISFDAVPPEGGIWRKPLDLHELIERVYVAPTSPAWFKELVEQVVVRYGLDKPVYQSSLDSKPLF